MKKKKYIPSALRKDLKIEKRSKRWGIGVPERRGNSSKKDFGMIHAHFYTEMEALEMIGIEKQVIIHFHKDSTKFEIAWKWSKKDYWKKIN